MNEDEKSFNWLYKAIIPITLALIALVGVVLTVFVPLFYPKKDISDSNSSKNSNTQNPTTSEKNTYYSINVIQNLSPGIRNVENAEVILTIEGQPYPPEYTDKTGQARFLVPLSSEKKAGEVTVIQNGKSRNQNITIRFNEVIKIMLE